MLFNWFFVCNCLVLGYWFYFVVVGQVMGELFVEEQVELVFFVGLVYCLVWVGIDCYQLLCLFGVDYFGYLCIVVDLYFQLWCW